MKQYFIVHQSGDSSPGPQFHKINSYHHSQGFPKSSLGFYGGYQYLIEDDGQLKQFRALEDVGAHTKALCSEEYCNLNGVAVCISGEFDYETGIMPNEKQLKTLIELWVMLKDQGHAIIPLGHRDLKSTKCPGFDARTLMEDLHREYLGKRLKIAEAAIHRVKPPRLNTLIRFIERLKQYLRP